MSGTCDMLQSLIDRVAAGEAVGASVEELTAFGAGLVRVNAKVRQTIAVLICEGKRFFADPGEWVRWIDENFAPNDHSDRCHLVDIGNLLTGLRNRGTCDMLQCYRAIFPLDCHKQLSLCRIARKRGLDEIPAFLSHTPGYAKMKRDAFRAAVAAWLEEEPKERPEQPSLPGFDDALDTFSRLDSGALREAVCDPQKAAHSLRAGIGLLGAALAYELNQTAPDTGTLQMTRAALLAEAHKIEQRLAEFGELE